MLVSSLNRDVCHDFVPFCIGVSSNRSSHRKNGTIEREREREMVPGLVRASDSQTMIGMVSINVCVCVCVRSDDHPKSVCACVSARN